jgi:hypothetical protein
MIVMSRRWSAEAQSRRKSLYARTHTIFSSSSGKERNRCPPNAATFGYSTCDQIPTSSMYFNRSSASYAAG